MYEVCMDQVRFAMHMGQSLYICTWDWLRPAVGLVYGSKIFVFPLHFLSEQI